MRFELTHRDLAMLIRYAMVGETYSASHLLNCNRYGTHIKFIKLYNFDTMQARDVCWCLVETML